MDEEKVGYALDEDLPDGFDPDDLDDQMFEGREDIDPAKGVDVDE